MKKGLTELIIILDESGSMSHTAHQTAEGFNEFINSQKKDPGETVVTLVKFNDKYEVVCHNTSVDKVPTLVVGKNYNPDWNTALLYAVGKTIENVGTRLSETSEENRPEKVMFLVITDGQENTPRGYSKNQVIDMIKHQQDVYKWEFVYIGADHDAFAESAVYGFVAQNTMQYDKQNTSAMFNTVARSVTAYKSGDMNWQDNLKCDS